MVCDHCHLSCWCVMNWFWKYCGAGTTPLPSGADCHGCPRTFIQFKIVFQIVSLTKPALHTCHSGHLGINSTMHHGIPENNLSNVPPRLLLLLSCTAHYCMMNAFTFYCRVCKLNSKTTKGHCMLFLQNIFLKMVIMAHDNGLVCFSSTYLPSILHWSFVCFSLWYIKHADHIQRRVNTVFRITFKQGEKWNTLLLQVTGQFNSNPDRW